MQVHLGGGSSATEANEHAMAVALTQYSKTHDVSINKLCVVGFDNSHHGSSTAALSASSTAANTYSLPAFPWPKAEFPQLRYPYAEFEHANRAEEERCVEVFRKIVENQRSQGGAVGAVIVEPMSSIGSQMATPNFFKGIR